MASIQQLTAVQRRRGPPIVLWQILLNNTEDILPTRLEAIGRYSSFLKLLQCFNNTIKVILFVIKLRISDNFTSSRSWLQFFFQTNTSKYSGTSIINSSSSCQKNHTLHHLFSLSSNMNRSSSTFTPTKNRKRRKM